MTITAGQITTFTNGTTADATQVNGNFNTVVNEINAHEGNTNNPHSVTAAQVGAVSTSDATYVHTARTDQANTFTGNQTAPALVASGLTGATAASRYVGATTSGAPTSGTFAVGDFVIDQTGTIWVCKTAGTPGTWAKPSSAVVTEEYLPLWWYSGGYQASTSTSNTSSYIQRGTNSGVSTASAGNAEKLHTLNANWNPNNKYAFEATLNSNNASYTANAQLYDITSASLVAGTQISTTANWTVLRSGQVVLTPGHVYGIATWTNNASGVASLTDASLVVFPS